MDGLVDLGGNNVDMGGKNVDMGGKNHVDIWVGRMLIWMGKMLSQILVRKSSETQTSCERAKITTFKAGISQKWHDVLSLKLYYYRLENK